MFSRIRTISLASAVAFLPIAAGAQTPGPSLDEREHTTTGNPSVTSQAIPPSTRDVRVGPSSLTTASLAARPIMLLQN